MKKYKLYIFRLKMLVEHSQGLPINVECKIYKLEEKTENEQLVVGCSLLATIMIVISPLMSY